MKERIRKNLCKCCIVIPFILGFIGFLEQYPGEYLDAIWFAIHLYGFDCDVEQITPILEVARWTAPLATMTTLFLAVEAVARAVLNRLALFNRNTVAIYGKSKAVNCLSEDINKHKGNHKAILANHFVSAHTHVVMLDNDEDNLLFFLQNYDKFHAQDRVYLQLEDFSPHALNCDKVDLYAFSLSDLTAQLYWKSQAEWVCEQCYARNNERPLKIYLIGTGLYIEKILHYGLLSNLYSLNQSIEYHLFGEWSEYRALHFDWDSIAMPSDKVIFHTEPWYQEQEQLSSVDKIIICDDDQKINLHIVQRIQSLIPKCKLDVRLFDDNHLRTELLSDRIRTFGALNSLCNQEQILQEKLLQDARGQHEAYRQEHPETKINKWECLDTFTRQSNVSSSFFEKENIPLIKETIKKLNIAEIEEIFAELEHIRWCRYHFLHNWKYGEGKKNMVNRTHQDLIPYWNLNEGERKKDWEALNLKSNNK